MTDLLVGLAATGAIALPTVCLASWRKTRPFAEASVVAIAGPFLVVFSFGIGGFIKAAAADPAQHRCGLYLVVTGLALLWTIGSILVTAGALALFESTRGVARRVLRRALPLLLLAAVAAGLLGRYRFW